MSADRLEGKVAQILNARELVINIGRDAGVKNGMKFAVLAAQPLEVTDPDTNTLLGTIDRVKVRVQAVEVQSKLSICRTYEYKTVGGLYSFTAITDMLTPQRQVPKTLKASDDSYSLALSEEESYVKVGDRVKEIVEVKPESK